MTDHLSPTNAEAVLGIEEYIPESNTATESKVIEGQFVALIEYYNIFVLWQQLLSSYSEYAFRFEGRLALSVAFMS